jgi:hypothetical protein
MRNWRMWLIAAVWAGLVWGMMEFAATCNCVDDPSKRVSNGAPLNPR